MDRLGARAEERDSDWVLGMQRARLDFDPELLRDLSARLGRHPANGSPVADLFAQFILPLDPSSCATSRERTAAARVAAQRSDILIIPCPLRPKSFISTTIPARGSIPRCWRR